MTSICNAIILIMRLDVFDRKLDSKSGSTLPRGTLGIGYKLTDARNYDVEYKRLYNIEKPKDSLDAVNLNAFQSLTEEKFKELSH